MNTPTITLPHVALPDLPRVDVGGTVGEVSDRFGDVTARFGDLANDLAAAARGRANEVALAAAELLEDVPDRALSLAAVAIPALRPAPKRSAKPFVLLAVAAVVAVAGIWFWRRRAADSVAATTAATPLDHRSPAAVSAVS